MSHAWEALASGATHVGRQRDHDEDRVLLRDDLALYLVADGAGGHRAGDVASSLALESIVNYFAATEEESRARDPMDRFGLPVDARRLSAAIRKANRDVVEISKKEQRYRGMGTTVVAVRLDRRLDLVHLAHVGDSRCYRLRAGHLEQLTDDHSLINDVLEERPEIDDSVVDKLPKHVVTRALGMTREVRVSVRSLVLSPGDRYLLCSDGLSGPVAARDIGRALAAGDDPATTVRALIDAANAAGGPDNVSSVVLDLQRTGDAAPVSLAAPPAVPRRRYDDSQPEILVLGIEEVELDGRPEVAIVPEAERSEDLIAALGDLIRPPGIGRRRA